MILTKKKPTVSIKEFNEMKDFLLAQIKKRDEQIKKLKEEKQIILNMAIKHSETKVNTKNATKNK